MNVTVRKSDPITVDDFLTRIGTAAQNGRRQVVRGAVVRPMTGATRHRAAIGAAATASLVIAAQRGGGRALPDILVRRAVDLPGLETTLKLAEICDRIHLPDAR